MRILYIAHTRFPTEKAHGCQIAQVCGAMAELRHGVTLVTPTVKTPITESPFTYCGVPENFRWEQIPSFDALSAWFVPNSLAFIIGMGSYRRCLRRFLMSHSFDLLYCRSHAILRPLLTTGTPIILELHTLPRRNRSAFVRACNQCKRVVCLTTPMRAELASWGVDARRIVVEGDAVPSDRLRDVPPVEYFRKRFAGTPIIGYVGSLLARNTLSKGVEILIDALTILKRDALSFHALIVGGPNEKKRELEARARRAGLTGEDVIFVGHVPGGKIPPLIEACDLCVFPAPRTDHPYFLRDTSPLKIFEYMAAGKPVIAADLPPIRDILSEETAFFCAPGDAHDMACGLRDALMNPAGAHGRAQDARRRVEDHTWEKRMERVLAGMYH